MCCEGLGTANRVMPDKNKKEIRKSAAFLGLGAEVAGAIAAGAFIGYWLDNWLNTPPLFIIIMVLASTVAIFWRIRQMLAWMEDEEE